MRLSVFLALNALSLTALTLGACRDKGADTAVNQDAGLTAERIASNDVTAIDAVTADAANMAADIDYADMLNELSNNGADSNTSRAQRAPQPQSRPAPRPSAPTPAANETAATNSQ